MRAICVRFVHSGQGAAAGIREVRGTGLYFGIELPSAAHAQAVLYRCLANGPGFEIRGGTVPRPCTPMIITEVKLDRAFAIGAEKITAAPLR